MNYDETHKMLRTLIQSIRKEVQTILEQKGYGSGSTVPGTWMYGTINLQVQNNNAEYTILFQRADGNYWHWDNATMDEMMLIWKSAIKALYA